MKWTKSKKAIIIASSIAGVAIIAAATVSVFMFTDIGSKQWQYDKKSVSQLLLFLQIKM